MTAKHFAGQGTGVNIRELDDGNMVGPCHPCSSAGHVTYAACGQAAMHFAEQRWRQAIDSKDTEQESKWEQEAEKAEQKVEKASRRRSEAAGEGEPDGRGQGQAGCSLAKFS